MFNRSVSAGIICFVAIWFIASCVAFVPTSHYVYDSPDPDPDPRRDLSTTRDVINRITLNAFDYMYPTLPNDQIPMRDLDYGMTRIDPAMFSWASGGAKVDPSGVSGHMWLESREDQVEFSIYHFDKLNSGDMISRIEFTGSPRFGSTRVNGLYVAVRQGFSQRYTWYGPYDYNDDWEIKLYPDTINCIGGGSPSILVGVANGDKVKLTNIWIEVEEVEKLKEEHRTTVRRNPWFNTLPRTIYYRHNDHNFVTGYYRGNDSSCFDYDDYYTWLNWHEMREYELKLAELRIRELELARRQNPAPRVQGPRPPEKVDDPQPELEAGPVPYLLTPSDPQTDQPVVKAVPVL